MGILKRWSLTKKWWMLNLTEKATNKSVKNTIRSALLSKTFMKIWKRTMPNDFKRRRFLRSKSSKLKKTKKSCLRKLRSWEWNFESKEWRFNQKMRNLSKFYKMRRKLRIKFLLDWMMDLLRNSLILRRTWIISKICNLRCKTEFLYFKSKLLKLRLKSKNKIFKK